MKSIFIDTNILIDFISLREPFGEAALQLFKLCENKKIELSTSSHAIATSHYILRKKYSEADVRSTLQDALEFLNVISVTESIVKKALRSVHKDFEDAIQIYCAHTVENVFAIVTRDVRHFSTSDIKVYAPDEVLELLKKN